MCGVAGGLADLSQTEQITSLVERMSASVVHRGPDADGFVIDKQEKTICVLGHRRLSIIDLSSQANQPFDSDCGRYSLVYNGEIFNYLELKSELADLNYQFKTQSDTEVLLASFMTWGNACFNKFNGMFAGAIYDRKNAKLTLFRDRFGIKPLYYYSAGKQFLFCSETRILASALQLPVDMRYLARGIHLGIYEMGDGISAYQDLIELKPACLLEVTYEANRIKHHLKNYYNLQQRVETLAEDLKKHSYKSLCEQLLSLLKSAVNIRLRADVPVGVTLSGGLDSSLIMAFVDELHPTEKQAFSYGDPDDKYTEAGLVEKTCERFKVPVEYCNWKTHDVAQNFWRCLFYQDAPFGSLSIVAQNILYQSIQKKKYKVSLGGQGADEAFMGYRKFLIFNLKQLLQQKQYFSFLTEFSACLPAFAQEFLRGKYSKDIFFKYFSKNNTVDKKLCISAADCLPDVKSGSSLHIRQQQDILMYSLPTLLRYEDRNSMSSSVESRLPFMDYRLIEFACALPLAFNVRRGYGKAILRDVATTKVISEIRLARYKRGFDVSKQVLESNNLHQQMSNYVEGGLQNYVEYNIQAEISNYSRDMLQKNPAVLREFIALCWLRYVMDRDSLPHDGGDHELVNYHHF